MTVTQYRPYLVTFNALLQFLWPVPTAGYVSLNKLAGKLELCQRHVFETSTVKALPFCYDYSCIAEIGIYTEIGYFPQILVMFGEVPLH